MLPDVLIIGDSHSTALLDGCKAHGLSVEIARFSGNFWHAGKLMFHGQHGIWVRGLPAMQAEILAIRERLGGRSLISRDIPVIASMGYHMGRFVPMFGLNGHVTSADAFAAEPNALYGSRALVEAYVEENRAYHIRMAQRMARNCQMVMVVPPRLQAGSNYDRFSASLSDRMRAAGVKLFDPAVALYGDSTGVPAGHLAEDGVHGNELYGREVIGQMLAQQLIGKRGG